MTEEPAASDAAETGPTASAREAALREILDVISRSRDDELPVFEVILKQAQRLCDATLAAFVLGEEGGGPQRMIAQMGATEETTSLYADGRFPMDPTVSFAARAIVDRKTIHLADMADTEAYRAGNSNVRSMVDQQGIRTNLFVPLVSQGTGIGCLILYRLEVSPFSSDQIELVQTFAAQAVIAIENVRQFRELQTRLETETATSDVLRVISRSRDEETPVFDVIVENAMRLCNAPFAGVTIVNAERSHAVTAAQRGARPEMLETLKAGFPLDKPLIVSRAINEARPVQINDIADDDLYRQGDPIRRRVVDVEGVRTMLAVPLLNSEHAVGCIVLYRREVQPFSESEIRLLETFAAQAVIAIENVRQFTELQARLAREKATREVLSIISQSRDDEAPVFDVILRKAAAICAADQATLQLVGDGRSTFRLAAGWGLERTTFPIGAEWPLEGSQPVPQAILTGCSVNVPDFADSEWYREGDPTVTRIVDSEGVRSRVAVPLMSEGVAIGAISLSRREVRPFGDADIQVVETFAAQAVIAIENVRQFREVQARLERERASRDVLDVISTSRDDDIPVFRTILENASRICRAPIAFLSLANEDRSEVRIPAHLGTRSEFGDILEGFVEPITRTELVAVRPVASGETVLEDDIKDDDTYRNGDPRRIQMVDVEGARSVLAVPLISEEAPIGAIVLYRREVAPFSEDDLTLVRNFAAQAVIAIENVRQFREVQARLERETATKNILGVISQSRDDEAPVFDAILSSACRLCDAESGALMLVNDERTHTVLKTRFGKQWSFKVEVDKWPLDLGHAQTEAARLGQVVHEVDLKDSDIYRSGDETRVLLVDKIGLRTALAVPLLQGDLAIGVIVLHRLNVARAFSDSDIKLVESFASQAVIAIENVRQFKALETLNAELGDRVEAQVGEIERMGRLKRFLPSQVADAVVTQGDDILSSHRALIATLFCDIRGFTAFCERAEPEETIEVLQTYHEEMGRLLSEYGAGVEHRLGDGIMAIFNDPLPCDDPAGDAVRLALAMRARMEELCKGWKRLGHRLGFGVGVSLGYATVGMVGSEGRYEYTASGTAVNLASRLCDKAEDGEILISPRAATAIEDDFELADHGEVTLKGIQDAVPVHRVVAPRA